MCVCVCVCVRVFAVNSTGCTMGKIPTHLCVTDCLPHLLAPGEALDGSAEARTKTAQTSGSLLQTVPSVASSDKERKREREKERKREREKERKREREKERERERKRERKRERERERERVTHADNHMQTIVARTVSKQHTETKRARASLTELANFSSTTPP